MIKREMEKGRISVAQLASALQITHSSASGLLQRPTIQVQRLTELSEFFKYNFFREIAQKLPYSEPDYSSTEDKAEIAKLQNRVHDLELEVSILRQTIKDLVSR
jgi:predicted transcriptional regulator